MSAVTQTIPNYIFGISQQPDQLKQPGQLRDSINVTPDVIAGLVKRPGSRFIGQVNDNVNGKWFNYYRSEAEQYIGHIQPNGWVSVVNAASGVIGTVTQLPGVTFDSRTNNYLWNQQIGLVITAQAGGYTAGTATNVGTTNINPSVAPMGVGLEVSTAVDADGNPIYPPFNPPPLPIFNDKERAELKEIMLEALRDFHSKPNYSPYRLDELQE